MPDRLTAPHLISVIIPTLNEEDFIEHSIKSAFRSPEPVEVIVVDGGSVDKTAEKAAGLGTQVFACKSCRARQMNHGASKATGDILLFLHADTILPEGFEQTVKEALKPSDVSAGAFSFGVDAEGMKYRALERCVNLRSRFFSMPYGDQAFFVRREVFEKAGGYPDIPIMEDVELIKRLKQHGRLTILPQRIVTSARRWERLGMFRTTILNQFLRLAWLAGVSPRRIAGWYYSELQ